MMSRRQKKRTFLRRVFIHHIVFSGCSFCHLVSLSLSLSILVVVTLLEHRRVYHRSLVGLYNWNEET